MDKDAFFAEHYEQFCELVSKRKAKWRLTSVMEWEDVHSHLLTRIYRQLHAYDPERPLDRWVNTLISNEIMNLLRNHLFKTARPCVAATSYGSPCAFNTGNDGCSWTPSGKQCSECKFYARWAAKKQAKHAINTTLSLENHVDESHSMQDDFIDFEAVKQVIDDNIKRRLTREEYRVYVLLYVKHLTMEEALKKLGFKKSDQKSYMRIRAISLHVKETAKAIISENSLIR